MTTTGWKPTQPWIGVDFDGTLARYPENNRGLPWNVLGEPIEPMLRRVQAWVAKRREVRIVTARVFPYVHGVERHSLPWFQTKCLITGELFTCAMMVEVIQDWTHKYVGVHLPITCAKDYQMIELWDDRAVQVIPNTGRTLAEEHEAVASALRGKAQG